MKKLFNFRLLVLIGVLITSLTTQVWAWTAVYLNGDFTGGNWNVASYQINYELDGSNSGHFFFPFYSTSGDKYWRLYQQKNYNNYQLSPSSDNTVWNVGNSGYKVGKNGQKNFKSTTIKNGVTAVHINQKSGGDESPYVWLERPTIYIWHNWGNSAGDNWGDNGSSAQKAMTDKQDGTYYYDGLYSGGSTGTNVGIEGSAAIKKYFADAAVTKQGSPVVGSKCRFTWNSSGYKGYDSETSNTGSLTITRYDTITFDANGATKGSVPSNQEVLYNTASTLSSNSGKLERVGYKFIGWNTSSSGGVATRYIAGGSITITSNTKLYAEWVAADAWSIKGGKKSGSGDDAMGNWETYNYFTYSSEHALVWSVELGASQTYQFKIVKSANSTDTWYGNGDNDGDSKITATTTAEWQPDNNWTFETGKANCQLTTSTAGTYVFTIDATHLTGDAPVGPRLRVYFPGDAPKVFLKGNQYIYLDGATNSVWKDDSYNSDFWFKATTEDVHTEAIECLYSNAMGVNYMYYVQVPDNDYVDRVQINRMNPSGGTWNYSQVKHGYTRTNAKQNCLVLPNSGDWGNGSSNWASLSWSTYCPPMQSATLTHDAENTKTYGGNGEESTPYIVATSSNIYVSATSVSKVDDGDMTPYYQFKKAGSNDEGESSKATHTFTASSTNGTKQAMTVVARNYLYSTAAFYGAASPASNSIYYEAHTPYTVTHTRSHVTTASGDEGSNAAVNNVEYDASFTADTGYELPDDVTVTCGGSDITEACTWAQESGTLTIPAASVGGDIVISVTGTAKTTTVTLDPNTASHGTGDELEVTATYDSGTLADFVAATPAGGYDLIGYYTDGDVKIVEADGSLVRNTAYTSDEESPVWKSEAATLTLYAHYEEHTYSITIDKGDHGAANGSGAVVFDATSATISTGVSANAGYALEGYYDGSTKVLNNDGTFAATNVAGYITSGKWSKYDEDATLTAKFSPETLMFNPASGSDWNTASNWSPACVPTIEHDVIIQKTCRITNKDAKAKSVKIDSYLEGDPRLYVEYGGGLVVAEGITAKHKSDGSYEHTTDLDLWIRTDDDYNSGLICGNASSNTEATYIFYSKVYRWGSYYINQYVGIPYTTMSPYQWYGVYVFEYDDANDAWKNPDDGDLKPFTAYDIISRSSEENYTTFYTDGVLNMPGTSGTKTLTCTGTRCKSDGTFDKGGDFLFANSWTAPISVAAFESTDYSNIHPSVYIFNAGYIPGGDDTKVLGDLSGTWSTISFDAAAYTDNSVIPATQAFLVTAKAAGATLTLDYGKHVYTPALSSGINNAPLKAPKRSSNEEAPTRLKMTVQIDSVKADILYLFEREDFTTAFDDGWDGYKVMGESFAPQLYAINGESQLAIDAVPELDNTEIGFKAGTRASEYTFAFNYNDDEPLYLYDKDTQEFTQISNEATYTFTTNDTDEHARFIITRSNNPAVLTAIENSEVVIQAEKFFENGQLFIKRGERMYDATGALVK